MKISLRTKIYLTIAALLVTLGTILEAYAAPVAFSSGAPIFALGTFFPTGVAASPDLLLVTPYCSEDVVSLDCTGAASVYATFPGFGSCREKYMAMAPAQSAAAGFSPRDVFATEGPLVFKITNGSVALFADVSQFGGGGTLTIPPPPLLGTTTQRSIQNGTSKDLQITFQNNVDTNPSQYTGSATLNPFGSVTTLP